MRMATTTSAPIARPPKKKANTAPFLLPLRRLGGLGALGLALAWLGRPDLPGGTDGLRPAWGRWAPGGMEPRPCA